MSTRPAITRDQWLTLTAALLGWGFDGFEMGVFPVVARPALSDLLGSSLSDLSVGDAEELIRRWTAVLAAAFLFGAAIGGFVFGWLGDRIGRVRAMAAAVLTYALLTGAGGLAQNAHQLAASRFLAALGMGGEWALGVALVMETWPAEYRAVLAGLFGAVANFGYLLVALLALNFDLSHQWRGLFFLCALPAGLTFFIRLFVPESDRWRKAAAAGPRARLTDVFAPGPRSRALLGAAIMAVALTATWGAVQFTQLWAQQMTGSSRSGAIVQIWSAGFGTVGALLAPIFLQKKSRRLGYGLLCLAALVAGELLFLTQAVFDLQFLFCVGLLGFTSAAFYGWMPLYLPELFPTRVRAAGQGFCYNAGRSLAAVGVLVTTFQIDVRGMYPQASALVCSVYVIGIALAWFMPETAERPLPD